MVKTSTYPYDELNRIQTEADPSGLINAYAYDVNNNIQTVIATASSNSLLSAAGPNVQNSSSTEVGNPLSASLNLAPNLNETSEISEVAQSAQNVTNTVVTPQSYVMTYTYDMMPTIVC